MPDTSTQLLRIGSTCAAARLRVSVSQSNLQKVLQRERTRRGDEPEILLYA
jgi:hypothetical protein